MTAKSDAVERGIGPGAWIFWVAGMLAAGLALTFTMVVWQINCPGAAAVSPQRAVCDSVGGWGGQLAMGLGLVVAGLLSFMLVRLARRIGARTYAAMLLIGALAVPPLGPILALAALSTPSGYCTPAQQRAEREAIAKWEAMGRNQGRPYFCAAYEGDF